MGVTWNFQKYNKLAENRFVIIYDTAVIKRCISRPLNSKRGPLDKMLNKNSSFGDEWERV